MSKFTTPYSLLNERISSSTPLSEVDIGKYKKFQHDKLDFLLDSSPSGSYFKFHYHGKIQIIPFKAGNDGLHNLDKDSVSTCDSIEERVFFKDSNGRLIEYPDIDLSSVSYNASSSVIISDYTQYDELNNMSTKKNMNNRKSDGFRFTVRAKNKIKNVCHYLYRTKPDDVSLLFYTFTVPRFTDIDYDPKVHDGIITAQFSKLLEGLRNKNTWGLKSYLWVAERQQTGEIHYHCIFLQRKDIKLNVKAVNLYWCKLLLDTGLSFDLFADFNQFEETNELARVRRALTGKNVANDFSTPFVERTRYSIRKLKLKKPKMRRDHKKGIDVPIFTQQPLRNPVDAKRVKSAKQLGIYLSKYLSKTSSKPSEDNNLVDSDGNTFDKFYCRTFGMTRDLSSLKLEVDVPFDKDIFDKIRKHKYVSYEKQILVGEKPFTFTTIVTKQSIYEDDLLSKVYERIIKQNDKSNVSPPTDIYKE